MRIFLIRHAEAVNAAEFEGPDMDRRLTAAGRKGARETGRWLMRYAGRPDSIYSSEARRARETARRIAKAVGQRVTAACKELNPGCSPAAFRAFMRRRVKEAGVVVVVGHEPDISKVVSSLVSRGGMRLKVGKGAAIEIEVEKPGNAVLRGLVPPAAM